MTENPTHEAMYHIVCETDNCSLMQRIKELEAELRTSEAEHDHPTIRVLEARLAAAELVVEVARVCPPNMDRFKEKLTALRDAVAAYDSHLNGGLACPSPENPCMCRCHLDNECSDCQVGRHEPQNLNSEKQRED